MYLSCLCAVINEALCTVTVQLWWGAMTSLFYSILQSNSCCCCCCCLQRKQHEGSTLDCLLFKCCQTKINQEHRDVSGTVLTLVQFMWWMTFSLAAWTLGARIQQVLTGFHYLIPIPSPSEVCFMTFLPCQRGVVRICWWAQKNALRETCIIWARSVKSLPGTGSGISSYFAHVAWCLICLCDNCRPLCLILYDWASVTRVNAGMPISNFWTCNKIFLLREKTSKETPV